jgi:hypothetical protein
VNAIEVYCPAITAADSLISELAAAGHVVRSDQPRALAALIQEFVSG